MPLRFSAPVLLNFCASLILLIYTTSLSFALLSIPNPYQLYPLQSCYFFVPLCPSSLFQLTFFFSCKNSLSSTTFPFPPLSYLNSPQINHPPPSRLPENFIQNTFQTLSRASPLLNLLQLDSVLIPPSAHPFQISASSVKISLDSNNYP